MKPKTKLQKRVSELMGFCMGITKRKMRDDEKLRKKRDAEMLLRQKEQEKAFLARIAKFADLTSPVKIKMQRNIRASR